MLLQLQQVPSAGESTKMAVKYQQEPEALVVGEAVCPPFGVGQFEWNRPPAGLPSFHALCHRSIPASHLHRAQCVLGRSIDDYVDRPRFPRLQ